MLLGLRRAPKMSLSVIHTFVTIQPLPQEAFLGMRLVIIVSLCYLSVDSRKKTDLGLSVHGFYRGTDLTGSLRYHDGYGNENLKNGNRRR